MPGIDPDSMDAKLADIADNADQLHFSSTAPASLTPGGVISGSFGYVALTVGDGNGDWAISDGTNAGDRKLTLAAQQITTDPSGGVLRSVIAYDSINLRIKAFWDAISPYKTLNGGELKSVPSLRINDKAPVNV